MTEIKGEIVERVNVDHAKRVLQDLNSWLDALVKVYVMGHYGKVLIFNTTKRKQKDLLRHIDQYGKLIKVEDESEDK